MLNLQHSSKIYDLNVVSSLLGRFYSTELSDYEKEEIEHLLHHILIELALNKPEVPYTDPVLIDKAIQDTNSLINITLDLGDSKSISSSSFSDVKRALQEYRHNLQRIKNDGKLLLSPNDIETTFGFRDIFENYESTLTTQLEFSRNHIRHPETPIYLGAKVKIDQTSQMVNVISRLLFDDEIDEVFHTSNQDTFGHHLFWTTSKNRVNYFTPSSYELSTQFSFDLPHNVAHLYHLNNHTELSVRTYIDGMEERAYYESVAVASEHIFISQLEDQEVASSIGEICSIQDIETFRQWLIDDRIYESRLRLCRLIADVLVLEETPFIDIVNHIAIVTSLPEDVVRNEVYKYFPQTGLGAIYVTGALTLLRKLKENNLEFKSAIISPSMNNPIIGWEQFESSLVA